MTKEEIMKKVDYILVVNKDYEVVYSSRYNIKKGVKSPKNFFEVFPSLGRTNSSIVKTMSTGQSIFNDAQEWTDFNGKVYVTSNVTIPIYKDGQIWGVVELTKDLTTVGDVENKEDFLEKVSKKNTFEPNRETNDRLTFEDILTINDDMLKAIDQAKALADSRKPILIYGETGTGKEMFAQAIINYMVSPKQKVIIQNCAAVPENLIEGVLFGTTKDAYPGAEDKKGLFEEANDGIFFLDELNALPYNVQAKILRVLEEGSYSPIGSNIEKKTNVKIIAAINVDPKEAIEKNIIRKDLFYRLSNNMIYLKPLRERKDDIEYLTDNYIDQYNSLYDKDVQGITEDVRDFFMEYSWEGNVRELKHVIESMISLSKTDFLEFQDLPLYLNAKKNGERNSNELADTTITFDLESGDYELRDVVENVERKMIIYVLRRTNGNKTKAGEILGIPRQTLKYKMTKLGINDIEEK